MIIPLGYLCICDECGYQCVARVPMAKCLQCFSPRWNVGGAMEVGEVILGNPALIVEVGEPDKGDPN